MDADVILQRGETCHDKLDWMRRDKPLIDQITPSVQIQVEEEEGEELPQAKSMEDTTSEVTNDFKSQINAIKGGGRNQSVLILSRGSELILVE